MASSMAIFLGLPTMQVNSFIRADIGTTVFVEMPRGFASDKKVFISTREIKL
jgi:hypothetical protein